MESVRLGRRQHVRRPDGGYGGRGPTVLQATPRRGLRAARLAQGFAIDTEQTGRKASQKPRWRATSHDIDAQDIKHHLQELGFADHEFQIRMEFQRAWGCL